MELCSEIVDLRRKSLEVTARGLVVLKTGALSPELPDIVKYYINIAESWNEYLIKGRDIFQELEINIVNTYKNFDVLIDKCKNGLY